MLERDLFDGREPEDGLHPVDVHAPDGSRRFAGWSSLQDWKAARGEHVSTLETDPEGAERVIVRYRLGDPF